MLKDTLTGFKNFVMRGDVITTAVGLVIALAFSAVITAFTTSIINPLIAAIGGSSGNGLGWWLTDNHDAKKTTFLDIGGFINAIITFVIFMAVIYFLIVLPYKAIMARKGQTVFGEPAPLKTCPACLSEDLPAAASKCKYCGSDVYSASEA